MATNAHPTTNTTYLPIGKQEPILRSSEREISLLFAADHLSLTYASQAAHERVAGPHIHHQHTDAFYILEGELTFQIGAERETVTVGPGSLVAAPPGVAHSFRTSGPHPARWLTIHASDGGFAAFMRGIREGIHTDWDIAQVPPDGGQPADHAVVRRPLSKPPSS